MQFTQVVRSITGFGLLKLIPIMVIQTENWTSHAWYTNFEVDLCKISFLKCIDMLATFDLVFNGYNLLYIIYLARGNTVFWIGLVVIFHLLSCCFWIDLVVRLYLLTFHQGVWAWCPSPLLLPRITGQYCVTFDSKISPWSCFVLELY